MIFHLHAKDSTRIDFDCYDGHVVAARDETHARILCPSGDEGAHVWLDASYSHCDEIGTATSALYGVILSSFNAG